MAHGSLQDTACGLVDDECLTGIAYHMGIAQHMMAGDEEAGPHGQALRLTGQHEDSALFQQLGHAAGADRSFLRRDRSALGRHIGQDLQGLAGAAAGRDPGDRIRRGRQLCQLFLDDAGLFLEQCPQLGQIGIHFGIFGQLGSQGCFLGLLFRFGGLPLLPEQPAEQGQDQQEEDDTPEQGTAVPGGRDRGALGGGFLTDGRGFAVSGGSGIGAGDISGVFAGIVSHGDMLRKRAHFSWERRAPCCYSIRLLTDSSYVARRMSTSWRVLSSSRRELFQAFFSLWGACWRWETCPLA